MKFTEEEAVAMALDVLYSERPPAPQLFSDRAHRSSVMREYECSKGFWWRVIGTDTTKFDAAYDLDFPELKDAAIEAQKGRTE